MPAGLPPPREVGQQIHVDLVLVEDSLRQTYVVAHATDAVSRFQAAAVLKDKSSESFIEFLNTRWLPLLGTPMTIIADQGREFISSVFADWCDSKSIHLNHIAVGAPWQNGIAERSGGTLKAVLGSITHTHFISTVSGMDQAVSEAVSAYNDDVHDNGTAPIQCVTGRIPPAYGDVLNNFSQRLAEHSLISAEPSLAKQVALRETARLAMVRLHYSRSLRTAELARSRSSTQDRVPTPGDLVFFWRAQKYAGRSSGPGSRRKLALRRWHGPGLLVAMEGDVAANCFISYRGQLTKCPLEHVRAASSLESIAAGSWQAAIDEVIDAAKHDAGRDQGGQTAALEDQEPLPIPVPGSTPASLSPQEIVAALQPPPEASVSIGPPRSSIASGVSAPASSAAPGTPIPDLILQASQVPVPGSPSVQSEPSSLRQTLQRARSLDDLQRGVKRPSELDPLDLDVQPPPKSSAVASSSVESQPAFDALVLTNEELEKLSSQQDRLHPLLQLQIDVEKDRRDPWSCLEDDHGTWDGRWSYMCERDWQTMQKLGQKFPNGESLFDDFEVNLAQTARKEYHWSKMTPKEKALWGEAAVKGWNAYIDNNAIEILSMEESRRVYNELAKQQELDRILVPRFVCTDKNDGLRSASHPLPVKPSARMVVPGFKDRANLEGQLRRDAPTGSRYAQHLLFIIAAFHETWALISADVKAAFLKGDPYVSRLLWIAATNAKTSPLIPLQKGQLAKIVKGVFGLADAPRQWWLRLARAMSEHSWEMSCIDGALWFLWGKDANADGTRTLQGVIVSHVDDLLFAGSPIAEQSLMAIGAELGFGSIERDDFVWCGKRIRRAPDGTVRVSMVEYHENVAEIVIDRHRK